MIHDRGKMKWQPFIMPEQKEMMKQAEIESMKVKKPILDEGQLQEINDLLVESLQDEIMMEFTVWENGFIENIGPAIVTKIDPYQRKLHIDNKDGYRSSVHFDSLIGIQRI